jgi:alkaline phosphatase
LANATHSAEHLAHALSRYSEKDTQTTDLKSYIKKTLIQDGLGVLDITDDEVQHIVDHPELSAYSFADIVSRRAQIGWSTHGHSGGSSSPSPDETLKLITSLAVDVNIYSTTKHSAISGNHENTEVGGFIRDYLGLDLQPITKELMEKSTQLDAVAAMESRESWMGRRPASDEGLSVLDHYHGDFKH